MTYSVTEYTDFTNAFFTFNLTFSFIVHAQMKCNLCPYEEYGLPYTIFMKLRLNGITCAAIVLKFTQT